MWPEDFFKMNHYANPNQMSQSNNVSSVNSPSDFPGHSNYNNAINSGSLNHLTQCNNVSSLLPPPHLSYASQNNNASSVNPSNQVYQNNGSSSNSSNPGSSITSRSAMAISSILTGTQPHGNWADNLQRTINLLHFARISSLNIHFISQSISFSCIFFLLFHKHWRKGKRNTL